MIPLFLHPNRYCNDIMLIVVGNISISDIFRADLGFDISNSRIDACLLGPQYFTLYITRVCNLMGDVLALPPLNLPLIFMVVIDNYTDIFELNICVMDMCN